MKNRFFYGVIGLLAFTSCTHKEQMPNEVLQNVASLESKNSTRSLVANNDRIVLDTALAFDPGNLTDIQKAKAKAAVYRFYKHVSIVNGEYVVNIKDAAEINVSDGMFKYLSNGIHKMNAQIAKAKAEGQKVELAPVDDKYLGSLLKQ